MPAFEKGEITRGNRLLKGFQLSEWLVTVEDGYLRSEARVTRLEPLLMQLLLSLCARAGQVVSKQELLDSVWRRLVSDETVKVSVYQLRKALGDNRRRPRFIETLPKRGYRMLVEPVPAQCTTESQTAAQHLIERGRAALGGQPNRGSLKQAEIYFQQAIRVDPQSAVAISDLARTYVLMASMGLEKGSELLPRARVLATRAREFDPLLGEACLPLAVAHFVLDHDFESAEEQFRQAIELKPEDSLTHRWYARFLSSQNRHQEAVIEARLALKVDPLMLAARRELPKILATAGRYDEALKETHRLAEIVPDMPELHFGLTLFYYLLKVDHEVFAAFMAYLRCLSVAPQILIKAKRAYETGGLLAMFSFWARVLESEVKPGPRNQWHLIVLYSLLNDNDRCFEIIETAYAESNPSLLWLAASPILQNLRSDPRYNLFLTRLGFHGPLAS